MKKFMEIQQQFIIEAKHHLIDLKKFQKKMNREKQEREQQGKYIGKHQYDALKSVKTYFNY